MTDEPMSAENNPAGVQRHHTSGDGNRRRLNGLRAWWALGSPLWRRQMLALAVVVVCFVLTVVFVLTGPGYAALGAGLGTGLASLVMQGQRIAARWRGEVALHSPREYRQFQREAAERRQPGGAR